MLVVSVATVVLLGAQLWIMARQTRILDRQTALATQQAEWRRDEAIGTFYRVAHDLVAEFRKANVMPTLDLPADFDTHPRQMLRQASSLFAPLGTAVVLATTQAAMRLDEYFSAVEAYNRTPYGRDGAERWRDVQTMRELVGGDLDQANSQIAINLRWKYSDGKEYDFRALCSLPPHFFTGGVA